MLLTVVNFILEGRPQDDLTAALSPADMVSYTRAAKTINIS